MLRLFNKAAITLCGAITGAQFTAVALVLASTKIHLMENTAQSMGAIAIGLPVGGIIGGLAILRAARATYSNG